MEEHNLKAEISKLKRWIIVLSVVIFVVLILLFIKEDNNHPTPVTNELNNSATIDQSALIDQLEKKFINELNVIRSELETTINRFELTINNQQETINLLREPNILTPFHTYSGQSGILYRNIEGEGRWIPNVYGYELSRLVDHAIRRANSVIEYPENYILINYHLDELGPSIDIIIDLDHNKVLINDKHYEINEFDLEKIIDFLETNSIDGNVR